MLHLKVRECPADKFSFMEAGTLRDKEAVVATAAAGTGAGSRFDRSVTGRNISVRNTNWKGEIGYSN